MSGVKRLVLAQKVKASVQSVLQALANGNAEAKKSDKKK